MEYIADFFGLHEHIAVITGGGNLGKSQFTQTDVGATGHRVLSQGSAYL
jgi:hypothetical protein